jgi:hypothetical protein
VTFVVSQTLRTNPVSLVIYFPLFTCVHRVLEL